MARLSLAYEAGALWVKRDGDASSTRLTFSSVGFSAGLSLVPSLVNISFSIPQMKSGGTIYTLAGAGETLTRDELTGAFLGFEVNGDVGIGGTCVSMFIGGRWWELAATLAMGAVALPMLFQTFKACVFYGGMTGTLLPVNFSGTVNLGYIE